MPKMRYFYRKGSKQWPSAGGCTPKFPLDLGL